MTGERPALVLQRSIGDTPAERVAFERKAQGLPLKGDNPLAYQRLAVLLARPITDDLRDQRAAS